jgi:hypothetical protein
MIRFASQIASSNLRILGIYPSNRFCTTVEKQAAGVADREEIVKIYGEEYHQRADVANIGGLSAHAG